MFFIGLKDYLQMGKFRTACLNLLELLLYQKFEELKRLLWGVIVRKLDVLFIGEMVSLKSRGKGLDGDTSQTVQLACKAFGALHQVGVNQ